MGAVFFVVDRKTSGKNETKIKSMKLRIQNQELRIKNYELRIMNQELRITNQNPNEYLKRK